MSKTTMSGFARRRFQRRFAAFLCLSALVPAQLAWAQAPASVPVDTSPPSAIVPKRPAAPSQTDLTEAKRLADQGAKLSKQKLYEPAADAYAAAYRLGGRKDDLRKLAQARKDLGQFALAYDADEALLANHGPELGGGEKAALTKEMAGFDGKTALIDVRTTESGAAVLVDGRVVAATPIARVLRVDEGRHVLQVTKRGFDPFETALTVVAKQPQAVQVKLDAIATQARVVVREQSGNAVNVFVDDKDMGPAPWQGVLDAGDHVIAGKGTTFAAAPQTIRVAPSKQPELQIVLEATATSGHVVIEALDRAPILVDDKPMGTGRWEGDLTAGEHEVEVVAKGEQQHFVKKVKVESGRTLTVSALGAARQGPTADELARAEAKRIAERDQFYGVYSNFSIYGALPALDIPRVPCPTDGSTTCQQGTYYAYGVLLQLGYRIGFLGIDLTAGFLGTGGSDTYQHQANAALAGQSQVGAFTYDETLTTSGYAGYAGLGPRLMTKGETFNLSAGVNGGVAVHAWHFERQLSGGLTDVFATNANAITPAMTADLRLVIGSVPGAKFTLGVLAIADFVGTVATAATATHGVSTGTGVATVSEPLPPFTIADGLQIYVGPVLGVQLGR